MLLFFFFFSNLTIWSCHSQKECNISFHPMWSGYKHLGHKDKESLLHGTIAQEGFFYQRPLLQNPPVKLTQIIDGRTIMAWRHIGGFGGFFQRMEAGWICFRVVGTRPEIVARGGGAWSAWWWFTMVHFSSLMFWSLWSPMAVTVGKWGKARKKVKIWVKSGKFWCRKNVVEFEKKNSEVFSIFYLNTKYFAIKSLNCFDY